MCLFTGKVVLNQTIPNLKYYKSTTHKKKKTVAIEYKAFGILSTCLRSVRPLYALFQVDHSLCKREWTRTKQLSCALSSHPFPPQAHIPHSRLWNHFWSPSEEGPPMQKSINSWASTIHMKRKDMVKIECDREQSYREGQWERERNKRKSRGWMEMCMWREERI